MNKKHLRLLIILANLINLIKCFENLFQVSKKPKQKSAVSTSSTLYNSSMQFYSTVIPDINKPLNYCSFFNNRAPSPQVNLKNCTWYKENSCCLQSEIESTFSRVIIKRFIYASFFLNSLYFFHEL